MSNPAVIKLQSAHLNKSVVWIDDNFGESIHIHIDSFRIDLTVSEFRQLYKDLCTSITQLADVENFDAEKFDPVFLSQMLYPKLSKMERVSLDHVRLADLLAPNGSKVYKLPESVGVKELKGTSTEGMGYRRSHHIGQQEVERMQAIMESIVSNNYPYNDNYIVLYGDDNIIRDGQHRASCLYYLYGNIEVPVLRLYLKGYKSPKIHRLRNTNFFQLYLKEKTFFVICAKSILKKVRRLRKVMDWMKQKNLLLRGKKVDLDIQQAFGLI